jgi:hypothetical protein
MSPPAPSPLPGLETSTRPTASELLAEARARLLARQIPACLHLLEQAERAGADPNTCAGDRWQCWMLLGDWERAWTESDRLRARNAPDAHRFWDGSGWRGRRVMLRCLHGFGDAIQFIRYAPLLRRDAASLTVECAPRLVDLMRLFPGIDQVITWGPDAPPEPPAWDLQMEVVELPYILRATPRTVPHAVPYLRLPEAHTAKAAARMTASGRPRVGLVWAGGDWNRTRCIPFPALEALVSTPEVEFYSLQGGPDNADWATIRDAYRLQDAADHGDGLLPLAAVVANLDLVISIDTMAAHLAGSLAKPVWLLLQCSADWRWMLDRSDSPWYPTMRIFRQQLHENWPKLIKRVRLELERWIAERNEARTGRIDRDAALGRV